MGDSINYFTSDGGPHKKDRVLAVADGLRRIREFESAEMLTRYAAMLNRQAKWPSDEDVNKACGVFEQYAGSFHTRMRAALQATEPVQASAVPDWWVEKHQIAAGACPPQSLVILVGSLRRKGYIAALQPKGRP